MSYDFNKIKIANRNSLTYFNRLKEEHTEALQKLKSSLFEVHVRMEEISKTKNIYALNTNYRKNIFSPLHVENDETKKENEAKAEYDALKEKRDLLERKIDGEQIQIKSLITRCNQLLEAEKQIQLLKETQTQQDEEMNNLRQKEFDDNAFEFVDDEENSKKFEEVQKEHIQKIEMLHLFDQTYLSSILNQQVRGPIDQNMHKLEIIKEILVSDPIQAKLMLEDVRSSGQAISHALLDQLEKMDFFLEDKDSLHQTLENFLNQMKNEHLVDINQKIPDQLPDMDFIKILYIYRLLKIFFDNIYQHTLSKKIDFICSEQNHSIEFSIEDYGKGIEDSAKEKSKWYSGLHRADEIIFILQGRLSIENTGHGTRVRFSVPVK